MIESLNGKSLFALGGEEGLWVGELEKPNCQLSLNLLSARILIFYSAFKALPNLIRVTYCAYLEEYALVIIVADGVRSTIIHISIS